MALYKYNRSLIGLVFVYREINQFNEYAWRWLPRNILLDPPSRTAGWNHKNYVGHRKSIRIKRRQNGELLLKNCFSSVSHNQTWNQRVFLSRSLIMRGISGSRRRRFARRKKRNTDRLTSSFTNDKLHTARNRSTRTLANRQRSRNVGTMFPITVEHCDLRPWKTFFFFFFFITVNYGRAVHRGKVKPFECIRSN